MEFYIKFGDILSIMPNCCPGSHKILERIHLLTKKNDDVNEKKSRYLTQISRHEKQLKHNQEEMLSSSDDEYKIKDWLQLFALRIAIFDSMIFSCKNLYKLYENSSEMNVKICLDADVDENDLSKYLAKRDLWYELSRVTSHESELLYMFCKTIDDFRNNNK
ncbi:MAG: hypothetical protein KDH96_09550, partial [Candidatus Riesia sp.]|nr:hypothetical protein [Candidatus Riesia sp.]